MDISYEYEERLNSPGGPEKQKKRHRSMPAWLTAILLLALSALMGVEVLYFGTGNYGVKLLGFLMARPLLLFLNMLPSLLLVFALWFATGRAWIGTLSGGILALGWSCAEYWKLMARSEPIYAVDLKTAGEAAGMAGRYLTVTWQQVLALALLLAAVILVLLFCRERPGGALLRVLLTALTVVIGIEAWLVLYQNDRLYDSFPVYGDMAEWVEGNQYLSRGGLYPFLHGLAELGEAQTQTDGASAAYAENRWGDQAVDAGSLDAAASDSPADILAMYSEDSIPEDRQISVVCLMLESMADFSKYTDVITGEDPYALYHQMEAESYSGQLVTNIFAGNTINTERSVITGFSELGDFTVPSWSYARYFLNQGYQVTGAHAGEADYYDRQNVNENLGFPTYRFEENYYCNLVDGRPWDDIFITDIMENTLADMQNGPVFSYNVTYQNHGPYETDVREFDTEYVPEDAVDEETWYILNNYLSGVQSTWSYLNELKEALAEQDQPVVLVLFGDHKPWMGDGNSGYEDLGIDLSLNSTESFLNYYTTDYMIWANDAAKALTGNAFNGDGPTVSSCFLMDLVFQQCGWSGPKWLKLSEDIMESLPVISSNGVCMVDGEIVPTDSLGTELAQKLQIMEKVQNYLEYDCMK